MSYQKIDLVYGVTMSNSEYKNVVEPLIKKALKEISDDDDDDYDDYGYNDLGIVVYEGYYNDTYKVGVSIQDDEVRTMQDFVFDFNIPNTKRLGIILKEKSELFNKIGLKPKDFTIGVCTYNY